MVNRFSNSNNGNAPMDPMMSLASVYFLNPSNNNQKLVSVVFTSIGFANWKRIMVIALSAKTNLGLWMVV